MKLPNTFNDYPFVDGIIQLLHSDMNQVVIKTMELLYHHWDLFRDGQKHIFLTELLSGDMTKRLFLHWNVNVRQFYYYLTIYWLIQVPAQERKNKVDVYSFLKEFTKGRRWIAALLNSSIKEVFTHETPTAYSSVFSDDGFVESDPFEHQRAGHHKCHLFPRGRRSFLRRTSLILLR